MTEHRNGSPYDRGAWDSYAGRGQRPHFYEGVTGQSRRITDLSPEQEAEYRQGFADNEAMGDHKSYA